MRELSPRRWAIPAIAENCLPAGECRDRGWYRHEARVAPCRRLVTNGSCRERQARIERTRLPAPSTRHKRRISAVRREPRPSARRHPTRRMTRRRRDGDQLTRRSPSFTGVCTSGTSSRSDCSAASIACACRRSTIHARHRRVLREDRQQRSAAELGLLLREKIDPVALDRREHEPDVRARLRRARLMLDRKPRTRLGQLFDPRLPLAVPPVEQPQRRPRPTAQHVAQIMRPGGVEIDTAASASDTSM